MIRVEASTLVDAPRDDVFAILTEYGTPVRLRINPHLKRQEVVERAGDVVVCENEWERDGHRIRQRRRYRVQPPDRIDEEVVGATSGLIHVTTKVEPEGDQTRLTLVSEYRFGGIWRILGRFVVDRLREVDEELLATLKAGLEAEFEDVETE